jgi:glycosyltransferase involved in cell wall biosynthesis
MDADLQHPVATVREFMAYWQRGYQCVYAVRQDRSDESRVKRLGTRLFYWIVNSGSRHPIEPNTLDFRLLDRRVVESLRSMRESVRFTKGLYAWVGFRSIGVPVNPDPRIAGESQYNLRSLLRLAWDGITSFSDLPLRLSAFTGAIIALCAIAYAVYVVTKSLVFGIDLPGWPTLTVAIMFLSGVQMLFMGIIGEYLRNVYLESKARPIYLVSEVTEANTASDPIGVDCSHQPPFYLSPRLVRQGSAS